jgi:molybdenum cofactor cytidylyltransferase
MPRRVTQLHSSLWTVILAAGGSERLGEPKQLVQLHGSTLLKRTAEMAQGVTPDRTVVVIGSNPMRMRAILRRCKGRKCIVTNPRWRAGMSTSLRRGLDALPHKARAVLLLAVDQPLLDVAALDTLIAAWVRHPQRPAAARYEKRIGVPAIIPRPLWRAAKAASGDSGARAVLRRPGAAVTAVDMPQAALDIDTPEDLLRLKQVAA